MPAMQALRKLRRKLRQRAERAVDVKPELLFARDLGKRVEVIDAAGTRAAGRRDDDKRLLTGVPVVPR